MKVLAVMSMALLLLASCSSNSTNLCESGNCKADQSCCNNACGKCKGGDSCKGSDCKKCTGGNKCELKSHDH